MKGVIRTRVGYAGGTTLSPTYRQIGDHAEVIQIDFDPRLVSYAQLLEKFWTWHNPCGRAWSRQYMSAILYADNAQKALAEQTKAAFAAKTSKPVSTEIAALRVFTRAEDYHQKYYLRNTPWLFLDIAAVVGEKDGFTDSTAATRLNGWIGGNAPKDQLDAELPLVGLTPGVLAKLRERLQGVRAR